MGVAVLQPRDCLNDPFSINNIHAQRPNKPTPNRRRWSPPRHQPETSPPPKGSKKKKNLNHNHVRIPKRGEEKVPALTVEKPERRSTRQIVSDPVMIPSQNRRLIPSFFTPVQSHRHLRRRAKFPYRCSSQREASPHSNQPMQPPI
ncbi:hypothetical protein Bca4012_010171 [Brassica carinata]